MAESPMHSVVITHGIVVYLMDCLMNFGCSLLQCTCKQSVSSPVVSQRRTPPQFIWHFIH